MPQTNEQKYVYEPECELFHVHVSCEDSCAEPSITVIIDDSESLTTGVQLDMSWWVIIRPFIYPCATKRYHMWQYMAQQRLNVISNISVLSVMQFNAKSVFSPLLYRCLHEDYRLYEWERGRKRAEHTWVKSRKVGWWTAYIPRLMCSQSGMTDFTDHARMPVGRNIERWLVFSTEWGTVLEAQHDDIWNGGAVIL